MARSGSWGLQTTHGSRAAGGGTGAGGLGACRPG